MTEQEKKVVRKLLDEIIMRSAPKSTTVSKYGGVLYTLRPDEKEGQYCGIFAYKNHVQLSFGNGAELKDPAGVLQGNGKFRRHINFESAENIDAKILMALLRQSSRLSISKP